MGIVIVGCGAMGGLIAANFTRAGLDVSVLVRDDQTACTINREGLSIQGPNQHFRAQVRAISQPEKALNPDLILLAVKAYQLEMALDQCSTAIGPRTQVMTLQNGLGSPERVAKWVAAERVIVGVAENFGASRSTQTHIDHRAKRMIRLGRFGGAADPALDEVAELWRQAEFPVQVYANINQLVWEKLVCNTAFSGPTSISGKAIGAHMADDAAWEMSRNCARETYEVGKAAGIPFSFKDPERYVHDFGAAIPQAKTSMLQDIEAGRQTEVQAIHGGVVSWAQHQNMSCPHNQTVLTRILELELLKRKHFSTGARP